jgi:hypothetical protein
VINGQIDHPTSIDLLVMVQPETVVQRSLQGDRARRTASSMWKNAQPNADGLPIFSFLLSEGEKNLNPLSFWSGIPSCWERPASLLQRFSPCPGSGWSPWVSLAPRLWFPSLGRTPALGAKRFRFLL